MDNAASPATGLRQPPNPGILAELGRLLATANSQHRGALWRLTEPGRGLDANVVRLPAGASVDDHVEETVDVLLVIVAGHGLLSSGQGAADSVLTAGVIAWLPRSAHRSIEAGDDGLTYLTVHARRPALAIGRPGAGQGAFGPTPTVAPNSRQLHPPSISDVHAPRPRNGSDNCAR